MAMRSDDLRALVERHDAGAIVLRRVANFAWYTGGGDSRVDHANPLGVADVVVTPDGEHVVTSTIEAPRMREEQVPGFDVIEYPWHEGADATLRQLAGGRELLLDDDPRVRDDIARLRVVLDEHAQQQLRAVGADAAAALAEAAGQVVPGMSEHEAAGLLAHALRSRGLAPHVLLAATDERIRRHRHALPFGAAIERRVMLVTSAERHGLYANVTLIRDFHEPDPETARRMQACRQILTRAREATQPGLRLAEVFAAIQGFYADAGFPEEWRLHHQGGSTGYGSRETIATPDTDDPIEAGMAFAWNPSITGAKAEETFLLTPDGAEVVAAEGVGSS
jgi:Xaa-Pro dipeptidase